MAVTTALHKRQPLSRRRWGLARSAELGAQERGGGGVGAPLPSLPLPSPLSAASAPPPAFGNFRRSARPEAPPPPPPPDPAFCLRRRGACADAIFLRLLRLPPPPPPCRRRRRLLLLSPAVAPPPPRPPPPPALGRWSLLSRCRERLGDAAEPEESTSNNHHGPLPARPPSAPTHSPTPANPTSRSFERRRLQSLAPARLAPSAAEEGAAREDEDEDGDEDEEPSGSQPAAAPRGGPGAGPFLPEDACRAEAPAPREENARAPWLPVMERSLRSRRRRRRAPAVLREDPASLRARPRPVAGLTVPGAPPPRSEPRRPGPGRGQRLLTEQPPRAQGV
ncbi:uncharacterized protein [Canis lupus baileyi]|uniref:uncharacterized protein n=1 Tax=Canis lupus baileyi TaxID=143281 RepID=UPI003B973794